MAIETGVGWTSFAVDDSGGTARELDTHITQANMATTQGIQDITTLSQSARATETLIKDHQDTFTALFDDAANQSFDVLKDLDNARTITRTHSGQTLATESNLSSVNWGRTQSGELTAQVSAVLADGTVPTWS
jgi:hypothetical protein